VLTSTELDRLSVVLVSTRNSLNIGAAARAMCNFGFERLRLVNPYEPAYRDARSAVGAIGLLANAKEFNSVAEAVSDCTLVIGTHSAGRRQPQHTFYTLSSGASLIRSELSTPENEKRNVAILFGSEKFGLLNEDLSHCHWTMHIPTAGTQPSMNLGQAVAVCLYELVRDNPNETAEEKPVPSSSETLERTTALLLEALYTSGYMGNQASEEKEEAVRRLVRRLYLSMEDATLWLGMLRQILWKMRTK
jgi:TrmH family RNA methyltransferase